MLIKTYFLQNSLMPLKHFEILHIFQIAGGSENLTCFFDDVIHISKSQKPSAVDFKS